VLSNTTITCSVGNATAAAVTALIDIGLTCSVANAVASGISTLISRAVAAGPGNASATGVTTLVASGVNVTCSVGYSAATGVKANILGISVAVVPKKSAFVVTGNEQHWVEKVEESEFCYTGLDNRWVEEGPKQSFVLRKPNEVFTSRRKAA